MNIILFSDSLQDEHVLELSKKITNDDELMDFGIKVLNFPKETIKAAMFDHRDSIQAAARELLFIWLSQQPSRHEAYVNLQTGLIRTQMNHLTVKGAEGTVQGSQVTGKRIFNCGGLKRARMNHLASNLRIWVEGTGVNAQMIDKSKWITNDRWMDLYLYSQDEPTYL